ncbi:hypothetical protein [Crassaminicella profunda]|uniref:hypothetical protein n=1 Tax=Crassaminicella profunda TaxID=1286698 RepID=UPI001CA6079F|nr:hypothetical protein [Crassaminicella profunda]QZY53786.1 hypothetical protein K7H06_12025 [Crassaminicella profunda]
MEFCIDIINRAISKIKKSLINVSIILLCIITTTNVLWAFLSVQNIGISNSKDGYYQLIIQDEGAVLLGNNTVSILYKSKYDILRHMIFKTFINNDGSMLTTENCKIEWNNHTAELTLISSEGFPKRFYFHFKKISLIYRLVFILSILLLVLIIKFKNVENENWFFIKIFSFYISYCFSIYLGELRIPIGILAGFIIINKYTKTNVGIKKNILSISMLIYMFLNYYIPYLLTLYGKHA